MTGIDERLNNLRKATGMDIFEMPRGRGTPGGFLFVIPGTAWSADDVEIRREPGNWVLTWINPGTYQVHHGRHDDLTMAYLDLIAEILGCRPPKLHSVDAEKRVNDYGGKS